MRKKDKRAKVDIAYVKNKLGIYPCKCQELTVEVKTAAYQWHGQTNRSVKERKTISTDSSIYGNLNPDKEATTDQVAKDGL